MAKTLLLALSVLQCVHAGIVARMPQITPAPVARLRPRQSDSGSETTFAWYSSSEVLGSTMYAPFTYDPDQFYFTSTSFYYAFCMSTWSSCAIYTDCDATYYTDLYSSYSLTSGDASYSCGINTLLASVGATDSLYWLDVYSATTSFGDGIYYLTSPPAETPTSSSSSESSSTTSASSSSSSTVPPTPLPVPPKKKSNTGIIAGAAVGGVAVLGAVVLGVVLLLRRKRNHGYAGAEQGTYQAPPDQAYLPPGTTPMSPAPTTATPFSPAPPYGTPAYGYGYGSDQKHNGVNVNTYEQPYVAPHQAAPREMIPEMGGTEVPRGVGGPNTPGPNPASPGPNSQVSELPTAR